MVQSITPVGFTESDFDRFAEELNRDGICVIRNLFDRALIDDWSEAFDRVLRARQHQAEGLAPCKQNRYYLSLPWIAPFGNPEVFANPVILGVLDRVFLQEYRMVQLGVDYLMQSSTQQDFRRDLRPLFSEQTVTPSYAVAINFPLVEVTAKNGPFQIARGTHVLPRDVGLEKVAAGEIEVESFYLKPGDVMLRSPLALYRNSPNFIVQPCPMATMRYVMHWLHTPKGDITLEQNDYDSLPEPLQEFLRCAIVDRLPENQVETHVTFKY